MMEVKQNTPVDLNDLLTSGKNSGTDEVDDAVMTDLTENSHKLECDLITTTNDKPTSNIEVENGDDVMDSLIQDDDEEEDEEDDDAVADIDVPAELEDALLAEDDVLPKLISNKNIGGPTATDDDILADKVETSNSTTSSINVRDPGDDLDTLLSKINDIVEDCIDNESTVNTEIEEEDEVEEDNNKIESKECNNENKTVLLDESVIFMGVTNNGNESKLEETQDEIPDETQNDLESKTCNDTIEENLTKVEETKNSDIPEDVEMSDLTNNFVQDLNNGNVEEDNNEEDNIDKYIEDEQISKDEIGKDKKEEENIVEDKTEEDKIVDETVAEEKIEEDKEEKIGENEEKEKQVEEELVDNKVEEDKEEIITAEDKTEELITAEDKTEELITEEAKTKEHNLDKDVKEKDKVEEAKADKEVTVKDYNELTEGENKLQDTPKEILNIPETENKKENDISSQIEKVEETNHQITGTENHEEKTEVINTEAVQDSEITSNSEENLESKTTTEKNEVSLESVTTTDKKQEEESTEMVKKQDSPIKDSEVVPSISSESKETLEELETPSTKETNSSEKVENEDSDDDIVFYVDKPPETEKSKEIENQAEKPKEAKEILSETAEENKKEAKEPAKKSAEDDDDVVLLLDDDDEDMNQTKTVEEKQKDSTTDKKSEENQETKSKTDETVDKTKEELKTSNIDVDNSDNARDDFVTEKPIKEKASKDEIEETPEETNSNCSSSSNLLQEAKSTENTVDEPITEEAENENDEDEDDGDVELIETESKEADISEKAEDSELAPPAKRLRLSEDSQVSTKSEESNKEQKEIDSADSTTTTPITTENKIESEKDDKITADSTSSSSSLKRSHDVIELELDDKSNDSKTSTAEESINKKPRTEESASGEKSEEKDKDDEVIEIEQDLKEKDDLKVDIKEDIKAVPSFKPIPLYPPPKFEVLKSEESFSLEFLKKFRKSFDKMTKQDLEELVLQKVVEAIVHRSEFSEMRELIEKQEKLITAHRTKISELSKQFRDLEMVHNRVVKDIEQRNSQFIMPVKITRAVGLQVYIPNKKGGADGGSSASSTPSVPSSPQRPVSTQSTSSTPPQRSFLASQAESRSSGGNTASAGNVANVRRGCVQKITPTRPVPGANASTSTGPSANSSTAYRNTTTQAMSQPRILNKNASTTASASNMQQRARYISANQDNQRMQTQQQQQQQISRQPVVSQRVAANINAAIQQKTSPNVAASAAAAQRRSDPMPQPVAATSSNTSIVDNYMNTLTHLTGGNTAVSITPAKPKEKAVIDLTDEDEAPPPPPPIQNAQPAAVPVTQVPRRSLPVQNNTNSQIQYGRQAPPLTRIPPVNQMANNKNRQINTMQAQKNNNSFTSLSTPVGTSITRINVPSNSAAVQRVKYSHPAPLPATPPQAFNPSWKLPPPRPTIRISNLDNGIVISWTMEESMDRHAECVSYQIYAYQETSGPPMVDSWRHVGDVKAMLLPMAVTLTQFQEGQRYYFAVRAVDCHQRFGPFSLPKTWS